LHGNLVKLELASDGVVVRRAQVSTLTDRKFAIRPRQLVLAGGGIENARLLLASNEVQRRGIGNDNDLVGRFFADHPQADGGVALLPSRRRLLAFYGFHFERRRVRAEGILITSDRLVSSEGLLRFSVALRPPPPEAPSLGEQVRSVMRDLEGRDAGLSRTLHMRTEPAPNPDSRVTLSHEIDKLGVPKVRLNWQLTDLDRRSAVRSVAAIAEALGATGLARVRNLAIVDEELWDTIGIGAHHLGTARMHRDPRHGVVDQNCRVHGVSNLYVAGSAVFPTAGFANPTFTIVALAVRLAAHLRGKLR
jgi:choline dehydrogenase-like flavoprotein